MLTSSEKKFIQSWKEQSSGPRWKYYLQYIIAWTTVSFLCLFFLTKLIMSDRKMGSLSFFIILAAALLLATAITHIVYTSNEKRIKKILEREEQ